jgi:hypothetical protein
MGYAARVMRGLIIDYARNRQTQKRGGQFEITSLEDTVAEGPADERELTQIGEALDKHRADGSAQVGEGEDLPPSRTARGIVFVRT